MKVNQIAYYEECLSEWGTARKKLNPTGRWKLQTSRWSDGFDLYIEHKGWIFKHWIHERDIVFANEETEFINEC